jgi:RNA 3'-terminal phosphate cyclase
MSEQITIDGSMGEGGGEFTADITPAADGVLRPLELVERGEAISRRARAYLAAGVPVGSHLADQLLVPMAMAASHGTGAIRFCTVAPTRHTATNIEVIRKFMDVAVSATRVEQDRDVWEVKVERRTNGSGEPEKTYA